MSIHLGREPVPDEATIWKVRHTLEAHDSSPPILALINARLAEHG